MVHWLLIRYQAIGEPNNNNSSINVNTQHNHPPGSGIPAATGDEDFRILGYLPDEQDPSVGRAGTEVRLHKECIWTF